MDGPQQTNRALALAAAAVTLGVLLLGFGFDGAPSSVGLGAPGPEATPEPAATPTPAPEPSPTEPVATPTPVLPEPSTVRVLVANATDTAGLAATATDSLIGTYGYNALAPTNTTAEPNELPSAVYHQPGYEGDARRIAELLLIDASAIAEMPADPPVADLQDAHVLVIIGTAPVEPEEPAE